MKNRKPRIINEDLTGKKFGMMTVIEKLITNDRRTHWKCLCDCGGSKILTTGRLKSKYAKNCGCVAKNNPRFKIDENGERVRADGYYNWHSMKERCYNKKSTSYPKWGAKGITVCDRWLGRNGFENFIADMGPKPSPKHTIGRRKSTDNYCPECCKWETPLEQGQNKSNAKLVTHNGITMTRAAWARKLGLAKGTYHERLRRGWTDQEIVSTPNMRKNRQTQKESESADLKEMGHVAHEWELTG